MLIAGIVFPNINQIGVWLDYKINQDFIAKVLCVNKDKPELKCNGKCHLTKQLEKAKEKEEKQGGSQNRLRLENITFFLESSVPLVYFYAGYIKKCIYFKSNLILTLFNDDVFHPPQFFLT